MKRERSLNEILADESCTRRKRFKGKKDERNVVTVEVNYEDPNFKNVNRGFTISYEVMEESNRVEHDKKSSSMVADWKNSKTIESEKDVNNFAFNKHYTYECLEESSETSLKKVEGPKDTRKHQKGDCILYKHQQERLQRKLEGHAQSKTPFYNSNSSRKMWKTASRVLFHQVGFATKFPQFQKLSFHNQVELLRRSWSDLFLLGLVELSKEVNVENVLLTLDLNLKKNLGHPGFSLARLKTLTQKLIKIRKVIEKIEILELTAAEFELVKLCCLFGKEFFFGNENMAKQIPRLREMEVLVVTVKDISEHLVEDLFFSNMLGSISVLSVLPYILTMYTYKSR